MIAPDTNLLVRVITRDDPRQAAVALEVLRSDTLWIPKTVLLELEWVLRYSYGFDRSAINHALTLLSSLANAEIEDARQVDRALDWHLKGMDFADALHLASCVDHAVFATFDRKMAVSSRSHPEAPQVLCLE